MKFINIKQHGLPTHSQDVIIQLQYGQYVIGHMQDGELVPSNIYIEASGRKTSHIQGTPISWYSISQLDREVE